MTKHAAIKGRAGEIFFDDWHDPVALALNGPRRRRRPGKCRVCGCTDSAPCLLGLLDACHWVQPDLCSACHNQIADAIWFAWHGRLAPVASASESSGGARCRVPAAAKGTRP